MPREGGAATCRPGGHPPMMFAVSPHLHDVVIFGPAGDSVRISRTHLPALIEALRTIDRPSEAHETVDLDPAAPLPGSEMLKLQSEWASELADLASFEAKERPGICFSATRARLRREALARASRGRGALGLPVRLFALSVRTARWLCAAVGRAIRWGRN